MPLGQIQARSRSSPLRDMFQDRLFRPDTVARPLVAPAVPGWLSTLTVTGSQRWEAYPARRGTRATSVQHPCIKALAEQVVLHDLHRQEEVHHSHHPVALLRHAEASAESLRRRA